MRFKGKKPIFNIKDTWSLDATLSPIIAAGLRKFKEVITSEQHKHHCGISSLILYELFPEGGDVDEYNFSEEQRSKATTVWLGYIDEMVYAFDNKEPNLEDYLFDYVRGESHGEVTPEGFIRHDMKPDNVEEYDRHKVDQKNHNIRVQAGLALFGKHYSILWW